MDIDTWFILNGYMVKWVITLQYSTYIHTYTDNPYPPQTITVFGWCPPAPALQYFPLTSLQLQPPATSQVTVFFSHSTPAPACRTQ